MEENPLGSLELEDLNDIVQNFIKNPKILFENNLELNFEMILKLLNECEKFLNIIQNNLDLVLIMGRTGVGKSTFVNYLEGKLLKETRFYYDENDFKEVIDLDEKEKNGINVAEIFHDANSGTLIPGIYPNEDFNYCDLPGFDDNRCREEKLCASYATNRILNICNGIKGIIVAIDYKYIDDPRQNELRSLIEILSDLFKDYNKLNIIWLITKSNVSRNEVISKFRFFIRSEANYLKKHPNDKSKEFNIKFVDFILKNNENIIIGNVSIDQTRNQIKDILNTFPIVSKDLLNLEFNEHYNDIRDAMAIFLGKANDILDYLNGNQEKRKKLIEDIKKLEITIKDKESILKELNKCLLQSDEKVTEKCDFYLKDKERLSKEKFKIIDKIKLNEKKLSQLLNDFQIYDSNKKIPRYTRVFRRVGIYLLQNYEGTYIGPEYHDIKCIEHVGVKRNEVYFKDYIEIENIKPGKYKYKIELVRPTTVTIQIYILEKNLPENVRMLKNIRKDQNQIEEENKNLFEKLKKLENQLEELDREWKKDSDEFKFSNKYTEQAIKKESEILRRKKVKIEKKKEGLEQITKKINEENINSKIKECSHIFSTVLAISNRFKKIAQEKLLIDFCSKYKNYLETN